LSAYQYNTTKMPWGKYRNMPLTQVPADYLLWLLENATLSAGLELDVRGELRRRAAQAAGEQSYQAPPTGPRRIPPGLQLDTALKLIEEGRRSLARKHHPDREGGDTATMQAANQAADYLLEILPDLLGARR
jgi:hypothetical protein